MKITHKFKSQKADSTDTSLVNPTNWNDEHSITMSGQGLMGRLVAGEGEVAEVPFSEVVTTFETSYTTAQQTAARKNIGLDKVTNQISVALGGFTNAGTNKVSIGWGTGPNVDFLVVNVDDTNFGKEWPIDIKGMSGWSNGADYADKLGPNGWSLGTVQHEINSRVNDCRSAGYTEIQFDLYGDYDIGKVFNNGGYYISSVWKEYGWRLNFSARQPQVHIPNVGWRALGSW